MLPSGMTYDEAWRIALSLPGVEERSSYGTPACFVGKRLLIRLKVNGADAVIRMSLDEKAFLIEADPDTFYETDHYRGWPAVLARLDRLDEATLRTLLLREWRRAAPKRLQKAHPELEA